MNKSILMTAAITGALAVILGAFGAHALKSRISEQALETWHTGVQYQFYHVLALLFLAIISTQTGLNVRFSATCFTAGIILFSGSLYLLSLREMLQAPWLKFLGPVTPIGGLLFIAGWVNLGIAGLRMK
ncbi:MAG: DUF423 domain-containing protein [Mucilaginibacter polytrichastri]|nr:DUF423 domain-containing protein [Mucilaginibacter polytrichastri]